MAYQREDQLPSFGQDGIMDEYDQNKRFTSSSLGCKARGLRSAVLGSHESKTEAYCSFVAACIDASTSGNTSTVLASQGSHAGGAGAAAIASFGGSAGGGAVAILATSSSTAKGSQTAVVASSGSETDGENSAVIASADSSASSGNAAVIGSNSSQAAAASAVTAASTGVSNGEAHSLAGGSGSIMWHLFSQHGDFRLKRHQHIEGDLHVGGRLEIEGNVIFRGDVQFDKDITVRDGDVDCVSVTEGRGPLPPASSFNIPDQLPGADFAEVFDNGVGETIGNGLLVALRSGKVYPAREGEYVIGVTSATAGIILGNGPRSTYETNELGEAVIDKNGEKRFSEAYLSEKDHYPKTNYPDRYTVVGLLGQVLVRFTGALSSGDFVTSGGYGVGRGTNRKTNVLVISITMPYNKVKGYGVAKCLLK